MNEQITSAAELDALPVGSVVIDKQGDAWVHRDYRLSPWISHETAPTHSERLARKWGPLTALYRPDAPSPAPATGWPSVERVGSEIERFLKANTAMPRHPWEGGGIGVTPLELARAVLALFEAAVPSIKAEALREFRANMPDGTEWLAEYTAGVEARALRGAAERVDSEGHQWSGAPCHAFFRLADSFRADADRLAPRTDSED